MIENLTEFNQKKKNKLGFIQVKLIITWRGDGRVGIQILNFYWLPFPFSKIQTPHIEGCWMDGHVTH